MHTKQEFSLIPVIIGLRIINKKVNARIPLLETKPLIAVVLMRQLLNLKTNTTSVLIYLLLSTPKHQHLIGGIVLTNLINKKCTSILSRQSKYIQLLIPALSYCILCGIMVCIWNRSDSWFGETFQRFLDKHSGIPKDDIVKLRKLVNQNKWWKSEDVSYSKMCTISAKSVYFMSISVFKLNMIKTIINLSRGNKILLKNLIINIFCNIVSIGCVFNIGILESMIWAKINSGVAPPKIVEYIMFCLAGCGILIENNERRTNISSFILAQLIIGILKNNNKYMKTF